MFNGWVKALGLALLSLRESFASMRNKNRRLRQTSSSCPTLISSSSKNDDDGADDDDDVKKSKSSQHFTASMAVNTINSKNWGHSKSISPDALKFQRRGISSKNSTDDGDDVEWGGLFDTATSTSTTSSANTKEHETLTIDSTCD